MKIAAIVFTMLVAWQPAQAQPEERPFVADQTMFNGRLVGITFERSATDAAIVISLQFIVEEAYAVFVHDDEMLAMRAVLTDIEFDPRMLEAADFLGKIEAALPEDVRFGSPCLVVANQPGAKGLELLDLLPATEELTREFLARHNDYLLKYRRFRTTVELNAIWTRLLSERRHVDELRRNLAQWQRQGEAASIAVARDSLRKAIQELIEDCGFGIEKSEARLQRIYDELQATREPQEIVTLEQIQEDLHRLIDQFTQMQDTSKEDLRKLDSDGG